MYRHRLPRRVFLAACATACAAALPPAVRADSSSYPSQAVRVVVPFAAGGPTDVIGRHLATALSGLLGQSFVVENRAGAQGVIGTEAVENARPDGYTLLFNEISATFAIQPAISKAPPFDGNKDFTPIGLVASGPIFLLVNNELPARNARELVELSHRTPGGLTFGSSGGMGQMPTHIGPELLRLKHGLEARNIVYRGATPAMVDLASGRVSMMMTTGLATAQPFLDSGKVRILAVTGRARPATMPEIPTLAEAGVPLPELDGGVSFGLLGPAGMPRDIVARLEGAVAKALKSAQLRESMQAQYLFPSAETGAGRLGELIRSEQRTWTPILRQMELYGTQ